MPRCIKMQQGISIGSRAAALTGERASLAQRCVVPGAWRAVRGNCGACEVTAIKSVFCVTLSLFLFAAHWQ